MIELLTLTFPSSFLQTIIKENFLYIYFLSAGAKHEGNMIFMDSGHTSKLRRFNFSMNQTTYFTWIN